MFFISCKSSNPTMDESTKVTGTINIEVSENSLNVVSLVVPKGSVLKLSGKHANKFEFHDSVLSFKVAPDYEEDIHTYFVTVEIFKDGTTTIQDYKILLKNINDNPPFLQLIKLYLLLKIQKKFKY